MAINCKNVVLSIITLLVTIANFGCSSNNCPLDNIVGCNLHFYDVEGVAISYNDAITIKTLLPGTKTIYTYRKLGEQTIVRDYKDDSLIDLGYTESISESRNDTVLVNQASGKSSLPVPLSYFNQCDTFVISYSSISLADTLFINHESYSYVEIPECGSYRFHYIKSSECNTGAAIDHVEVSNTKVTYEGYENIKIYFNGVAQ